jgi:hypothetical protein
MDLRAQSRLIQGLVLAPLVMAPGVSIVLMLDVVHRAIGAR